jgi:hypothetical protein
MAPKLQSILIDDIRSVLYIYPSLGKDGFEPKDLNISFPCQQTPIQNLAFGPVLLKCGRSQMRQRWSIRRC